jgi:hypothetical protein
MPLVSVAVPIVAPPSLKVTCPPVGVPAPGATAVTVAVNVTACPYAVDGALEETALADPAFPTVWVIAGEALPP